MKRIVVIPAYNEERTIGAVVMSARSFCSCVIVVDDGSNDATSEAAKRAGAIVVRHLLNRGQGAALVTGTHKALALNADVIAHVDADGQHNESDIPLLIAPVEARMAQVVFGSRFLGSTEAIPFMRKLLLRLAVFFTRLTTGLPVTDAHNGLRAFSRHAAKTITVTHDRMAHNTEIVYDVARTGLSWREVPVHIRYTPYSLRKGQHAADALRIFIELLFAKVFE